MTQDDRFEPDTPLSHGEAWELLPWLVNRTLPVDESRRVEAHVRLCLVCRQEVEALGRLVASMRAEEEIPLTPELSRRKLDRTGRARHRRLVQVALVAQAATILLLLGLLLWPAPASPPDDPAFRTLTEPEPALEPTDGVLTRVVFSEEATEGGIRELLLSIEGRLIGGPSPRGVYTVLSPRPRTPEERRQVLERLRDSSLVRFSEPVRVDDPDDVGRRRPG